MHSRDTIALGNLAQPSTSLDQELFAPVGGWFKRSMDVMLVTAALIAFSPIFVLVAILVKLSDGGPIFYGHMRVGRGQRMFPCLKFRTMVPNSAEVLEKHLAFDPVAREEWLESRKLKNDPRITPVGKVLRRSSLDELPQLLNILRGDMSIVGPRPVVVDEIKKYGSDAIYYIQARPGLTGPWQVSGRNDVSYESRVAFDRNYVENWSIWTDVAIIAKTVPAVLTARGTY